MVRHASVVVSEGIVAKGRVVPLNKAVEMKMSTKHNTLEEFCHVIASEMRLSRPIEGLYGSVGETLTTMLQVRQAKRVMYVFNTRGIRSRSPPIQHAQRQLPPSSLLLPGRTLSPPPSSVGGTPTRRRLPGKSDSATPVARGRSPTRARSPKSVQRTTSADTAASSRKKSPARATSLEAVHRKFQRELSRRTKSPPMLLSNRTSTASSPPRTAQSIRSPSEYDMVRSDTHRSRRSGRSSSKKRRVSPARSRAHTEAEGHDDTLFDYYITPAEAEAGIASGELLQGVFRLASSWTDSTGYVDVLNSPDGLVETVDGQRCALVIGELGREEKHFPARNRALSGDLVVVQTNFVRLSKEQGERMQRDPALQGKGVVLGRVMQVAARSQATDRVFAEVRRTASTEAGSCDAFSVAHPLIATYPNLLVQTPDLYLHLGQISLDRKRAIVELSIHTDWPVNSPFPLCDLTAVVSVLPEQEVAAGGHGTPSTMPLHNEGDVLSNDANPPQLNNNSYASSAQATFTTASTPLNNSRGSLTPLRNSSFADCSGLTPPLSSATHMPPPPPLDDEPAAFFTDFYSEEVMALRELGVLDVSYDRFQPKSFDEQEDGCFKRATVSGVSMDAAMLRARGVRARCSLGVPRGVHDLRRSVRVFTVVTPHDPEDYSFLSAGEVEGRPQDVAFSCQKINDEGVYRLGVHTLDVSAHIEEGGELESHLRKRLTTVRLPHAAFQLLPADIADEIALRPGEVSPCLSVMWTVTVGGSEFFPELKVSDRWMGATLVHVRCAVREAHCSQLLNGCAAFPCPIYGLTETDNPVVMKEDLCGFLHIATSLNKTDRTDEFRMPGVRGVFGAFGGWFDERLEDAGDVTSVRSIDGGVRGLSSPADERRSKRRPVRRRKLRDAYKVEDPDHSLEELAFSAETEVPLVHALKRAVTDAAEAQGALFWEDSSLPQVVPQSMTCSQSGVFPDRRPTLRVFKKFPVQVPTGGLLSNYLGRWDAREETEKVYPITSTFDSYTSIVFVNILRRILTQEKCDMDSRTDNVRDYKSDELAEEEDELALSDSRLEATQLAREIAKEIALEEQKEQNGDGAAAGADGATAVAAAAVNGGGVRGEVFIHAPLPECGMGRWKPSSIDGLLAQDCTHRQMVLAAHERLLDVLVVQCLLTPVKTRHRVYGEYRGLRVTECKRHDMAVFIEEWKVLKWLPMPGHCEIQPTETEDELPKLMFSGEALVSPYDGLTVTVSPSKECTGLDYEIRPAASVHMEE